MLCFLACLGLFTFVYHVIYVILMNFCDRDAWVILAEYFGKSAATLSGKVIWITGASSGIGEKLAVECAKCGAKLVLSARRTTELERVKRECLDASTKLSETDILIVPFDVTDVDSHEQHFTKVIEHFGSLDILVNNAGRSQRALWENIDLQVDREMFELNVFGLVNMTRIAVKYFMKRGEGHVAVTSSGAGVVGAPFSASYTATKHAIHGYYNSLRAEKQNANITVTVACPGPVFSNILQECFTEKPNEKFGKSFRAHDKRMTGERCAKIYAIALANKLDEVWISTQPIMPMMYLHVYYPNLTKLFARFFSPKKFLEARDGRVSMKME